MCYGPVSTFGFAGNPAKGQSTAGTNLLLQRHGLDESETQGCWLRPGRWQQVWMRQGPDCLQLAVLSERCHARPLENCQRRVGKMAWESSDLSVAWGTGADELRSETHPQSRFLGSRGRRVWWKFVRPGRAGGAHNAHLVMRGPPLDDQSFQEKEVKEKCKVTEGVTENGGASYD